MYNEHKGVYMNNYKFNNVSFETVMSIFTIINGKIKILLVKKKDDPYKDYWCLPYRGVDISETLDDSINIILNDFIGFNNIYNEQVYTFSDVSRVPNNRVVGTSYLGLVDNKILEIKKDFVSIFDTEWFSIDEIPKMAFDHKKIIEYSISKLKSVLVNTSILKNLFPSDFTLPELQCVYEFLLGKKLDRRNFRKKFISFDLIEDTGYKNEGASGRPAKLYKFKDNIKEINLF